MYEVVARAVAIAVGLNSIYQSRKPPNPTGSRKWMNRKSGLSPKFDQMVSLVTGIIFLVIGIIFLAIGLR